MDSVDSVYTIAVSSLTNITAVRGLITPTSYTPYIFFFINALSLSNSSSTVSSILEYVPRSRWLWGATTNNPHLPCRLLLVVDDLDRCSPEQCVKVLEALVLLTENTPFIILLAVDPRVVVAAVEAVNDTFYKKAGVNGYEYLEKIIQVIMEMCLLVSSHR